MMSSYAEKCMLYTDSVEASHELTRSTTVADNSDRTVVLFL